MTSQSSAITLAVPASGGAPGGRGQTPYGPSAKAYGSRAAIAAGGRSGWAAPSKDRAGDAHTHREELVVGKA